MHPRKNRNPWEFGLKLGLRHFFKFGAIQCKVIRTRNVESLGDCKPRGFVVACNHHGPDSSRAAFGNGPARIIPGRVPLGYQPEKSQAASKLAESRMGQEWSLRLSNGEDAEGLGGEFVRLTECIFGLFSIDGTQFQNGLRGTFQCAKNLSIRAPVFSGHELRLGIKRQFLHTAVA